LTELEQVQCTCLESLSVEVKLDKGLDCDIKKEFQQKVWTA